jgi:glycosyltransferase involved in cell wall biosynthesis
MKITWVIPAFGHFRVPVYQELDALIGGGLSVIYSASRTGETRRRALKAVLGERAIGLTGEVVSSLGGDATTFANRGLLVPFQRRLLRSILGSRPDCLVAEGFFQWTPAALAAKFRKRIPLVIAYERTAHTERHAGLARTVYRRVLARAADAIACNGSLSREYCATVLGFPRERTVIGAMAADTGHMQQAGKAGPAPEVDGLPRPRFLFAGRLVVLKGVAELLEGWSRAAAIRPDLGSLAVVGDGPERARLEAFVSERAVGNVRFLGAVDYARMPGFYAGCDALVMPTLEDNWSLVVPEAMAGGKAVLCSVYNGCWPELVREGENGWLFDPRDLDSTARALLAASDARGQLAAMGQASRRIAGDYTPRRAAEAILQACEIAKIHYQGRAG